MTQQYFCLLSGISNEALLEVYCFLGCGVFFYFTTTTWIYKTKIIKIKVANIMWESIKTRDSSGMILTVNVIWNIVLLSSMQPVMIPKLRW